MSGSCVNPAFVDVYAGCFLAVEFSERVIQSVQFHTHESNL